MTDRRVYTSDDLGEELAEELKRIGMTLQGLATLDRLRKRGREAKDREFWIEAIAIRAYFVEYWLRSWVVLHTGRPYPERTPTLGALLGRARDCHLDDHLAARVKRFVDNRNDAIHNLFRGEKTYEDLQTVFTEDTRLPDDLAEWVWEQPEYRDYLRKGWIVEPDSPNEPSDGRR